jgi:hypothetical protein
MKLQTAMKKDIFKKDIFLTAKMRWFFKQGDARAQLAC